MVRDGYYYALASMAVALLLGWLALPLLAVVPLLLGAFCLWFFRDPERQIPSDPGAIVSPADGKVTDVSPTQVNGQACTRISIFLNVFNVHVNRSPIAGEVTDVIYKRGKFGNAMGTVSSEENEQNSIAVSGESGTVVFKQIAGLIARRIICNIRVGDTVARGERIGLIKFGSRVDVLFASNAEVRVKVGDQVVGGESILALSPVHAPVSTGAQAAVAQ
jgi:phosphatidylserine decarboxylase